MDSGSIAGPNGGELYYDYPEVENTQAQITLPAAGLKRCWVLENVCYGFNQTPMSAKALTIVIGADTMQVQVSEAKRTSYGQELRTGANGTAVITLAADDSGAIGLLEVYCRKEWCP